MPAFSFERGMKTRVPGVGAGMMNASYTDCAHAAGSNGIFIL
jgi:hypothetical protein